MAQVLMKNTNSSAKSIGPALLVVLALAGGCKSVSHYISPRIEGRVIDSHSHQPVEDVLVRRLAADEMYRIEEPPRGEETMEKAPAVRTGVDGRFVMDSERDFALIGKPAWYSVSLSFQHPGYETFTVTYILADATNTVKGEPLVKAGEILLNAFSP
jgi:hypothetical protein